MKSKFLTLIIVLFTIALQAQRDTLDYNTTFESDTSTFRFDDPDSIFNFSYTLDGFTHSYQYSVHKELILRDSLDSIMSALIILQNQQSYFVEEYYRLYQQTNSKLWNLQRQYARLEELYDALYFP